MVEVINSSLYNDNADRIDCISSSGARNLPPDGDRPTTQPPYLFSVWKVCVYGKLEGVGTSVTLSNVRYAGLGVPIPCDQETGVCGTVCIRGLAPNESYVSDTKPAVR